MVPKLSIPYPAGRNNNTRRLYGHPNPTVAATNTVAAAAAAATTTTTTTTTVPTTVAAPTTTAFVRSASAPHIAPPKVPKQPQLAIPPPHLHLHLHPIQQQNSLHPLVSIPHHPPARNDHLAPTAGVLDPSTLQFPQQLEVGDALVNALTIVVQKLTFRTRNLAPKKLPNWAHPASVFFSVKIPEISIRSYIHRLEKFSRCSPSAFIVALIYIDRIAASNPMLRLSDYNVHRLLIASLCVGAKFIDDHCYPNSHYARVGGIPSVKEMNRLETHLIRLLNFNLFVKTGQYLDKQQYVLSELAILPRKVQGHTYYPNPQEGHIFSASSMNMGSAVSSSGTDVHPMYRDISPVSDADLSSKRRELMGQASHTQVYDNRMKQNEVSSHRTNVVSGRHSQGPSLLSFPVEVSPVSLNELGSGQQDRTYSKGFEEPRQPRCLVPTWQSRGNVTVQHPTRALYAPNKAQAMAGLEDLRLREPIANDPHAQVQGFLPSQPTTTLYRPSSGPVQGSTLLRPGQAQNMSRKRPLSGPGNLGAVY